MRRESALTSLLIHAVVLLLLFGLVVTTAPVAKLDNSVVLNHHKLTPYSRTQGGSGARAPTPASAGRIPPRTRQIFIPPVAVPLNPTPKLLMQASLDLPPDIKLDSNLPNIGDPAGLGKLLSGGTGGPGGVGEGDHGRFGSNSGPGAGDPPPVYHPGRGGVTMPVAIRKVEPEYSEEARKARATGVVLVAVEIGPDGKPRNARVTRSFGLGLDEKALEAVKQWLFRPGTKDGKPVTVSAQIEVAFHLL